MNMEKFNKRINSALTVGSMEMRAQRISRLQAAVQETMERVLQDHLVNDEQDRRHIFEAISEALINDTETADNAGLLRKAADVGINGVRQLVNVKQREKEE